MSFVTLPEALARQQLHDALQRLSPIQRHILLKRLSGESDLDAIASALNLSRDSVRASLAFGVAHLRLSLSDAPMDRQRDDWLHRCRHLLLTPPSARPVPPPLTSAATISRHEAQQLLDVPTPPPAPALASARSTTTQPRSSSPTLRHGWLIGIGTVLLAATGAILHFASKPVTTVEAEPQRVPAITAPEAPLTAPDFQLVLLRQQYPDLLENLDFYLWLSEQEHLR